MRFKTPDFKVRIAGSSDGPRDETWDLGEIAPVVILVATWLLILGSVIYGLTIASSASPGQSSTGWAALNAAVQWESLELSVLLLGTLGVCWWPLRQWTRPNVRDEEEEVALVHVARLGTIVRWLQVSFVASIIAVILYVIAQGFLQDFPHPVAEEWGSLFFTVCQALGIMLVSGFGIVLADKMLYVYPVSEDFDDGADASLG